jgi:hypothetical protein
MTIIRRRTGNDPDTGLPDGFYTEKELAASAKFKGLITGVSGCGKTRMTLTTAPKPICVLNCDGPGAPQAALRGKANSLLIKDVTDRNSWLRGCDQALDIVERGLAQSIVVDTVTMLVNQILVIGYVAKLGEDNFGVYRGTQTSGLPGSGGRTEERDPSHGARARAHGVRPEKGASAHPQGGQRRLGLLQEPHRGWLLRGTSRHPAAAAEDGDPGMKLRVQLNLEEVVLACAQKIASDVGAKEVRVSGESKLDVPPHAFLPGSAPARDVTLTITVELLDKKPQTGE